MVRIGKIAAARGLQGQLILVHELDNSDWLKPEHVLFLEIRKGSRIPYFLTSVKPLQADEYLISVEDVPTLEMARSLVGKAVYVDPSILDKAEVDSPLRWIGYTMVDRELGSLGTIQDVYQAGPQWLAQLDIESREVLVPLVPEFILDINVRNRFVRVSLPDGLLDL
jgi:16S rRNA processing protein RimM